MKIDENITLLYVDDEPINLITFKAMFKRNFRVITASSGEEALRELIQDGNDINVVISDLGMPEMNGIEFIRIAKNKKPNIIYCILTGFDLNQEILEAINSKLIYKYFSKPCNAKEITIEIAKALEDK